MNLFWVDDFVFVCSLRSRDSLGNHVPKGFYIVAAMLDLYPSDRNKHLQPLKIKSPAPWKQDKKEITFRILTLFTPLSLLFLYLFICGQDVIGVWQCCLCFTVSVVQKSVHLSSLSIPFLSSCLRFNLHKVSEVQKLPSTEWILNLFGSFLSLSLIPLAHCLFLSEKV